ncbi:MAG: hypothetical protein HFI39_05735 [Lachnospiraceae bacterium]|nr:hypothetical protein [Lachnospiraceae bacterium]
MDNSFYFVMYIIILIVGLLLGAATWTYYRRFRKLNTMLQRSGEMTSTATGTIRELVNVRRRNRSFRWTNQYPVVAFTAGGSEYTIALEFAEQRSGYYATGGSYPVSYVPSEPECCIVEEFRTKMNRSKNSYLLGTLFFGFFTCNVLVSSILKLFGLM